MNNKKKMLNKKLKSHLLNIKGIEYLMVIKNKIVPIEIVFLLRKV
jgi:hypothetical protein